MSKNPTPERTLYLDIKKSEDSKLTTDPIERQEHLRECFEAEEQTILFDENRADEVLYYQKKTVEAKTLPELEKVEKLILNRVTLLNEVPELKATRKKLKDVLKYLEAEKREKAQNARTFEKPENSFADYLKHSDPDKLILNMKELFPDVKGKKAALMIIALIENGITEKPTNNIDIIRAIKKEWNTDFSNESFNRPFRKSVSDKKEGFDGETIAAINKVKRIVVI